FSFCYYCHARRGLLAPLPLGVPLGVFHNIFLSKQPSECFRTSYWNFHKACYEEKNHEKFAQFKKVL
ncbi:MAG: hypothetical protein IJG81_11800, partial [Muribaculaceae bacterium]|nr:hypothetical protein [Muribaculaceae bacterium]